MSEEQLVSNPNPSREGQLRGAQTRRLDGLLPRIDAAAKASTVMDAEQKARLRGALVACLCAMETA